MAIDINYSPEQHDSFSDTTGSFCKWWCEKCHDYHYYQYGLYGQQLYGCPYEDYDFCPHCGQLMRKEYQGGLE